MCVATYVFLVTYIQCSHVDVHTRVYVRVNSRLFRGFPSQNIYVNFNYLEAFIDYIFFWVFNGDQEAGGFFF